MRGIGNYYGRGLGQDTSQSPEEERIAFFSQVGDAADAALVHGTGWFGFSVKSPPTLSAGLQQIGSLADQAVASANLAATARAIKSTVTAALTHPPQVQMGVLKQLRNAGRESASASLKSRDLLAHQAKMLAVAAARAEAADAAAQQALAVALAHDAAARRAAAVAAHAARNGQPAVAQQAAAAANQIAAVAQQAGQQAQAAAQQAAGAQADLARAAAAATPRGA